MCLATIILPGLMFIWQRKFALRPFYNIKIIIIERLIVIMIGFQLLMDER